MKDKEEKLIGLQSECCKAPVTKYYNQKQPGYEEGFVCSECDKECDIDLTNKI